MKSVSAQKVSQNSEMVEKGSYMVKSGLDLIGPDSWKSARPQKVSQNVTMAKSESQKFKTVLGGKIRAKTGLAPNSLKSASLQKVSQTDELALRDHSSSKQC